MLEKGMIRKGMMIDLEGTDGSGKGTTAKNLKEALIEMGFDVEIVDFPQHNTVSGALVDNFLYDGLRFSGNNIQQSIREGMLYAIDRMVTMSAKDENGLSLIDKMYNGTILIMDRYVPSNFIHRATKLDEYDLKNYINIMESIEYSAMALPEPDYTIVLDVEPTVAYENIIKRGRQTDENETLENIIKAHDKIKTLCEMKDYVLVNCCEKKGEEFVMKSPKDILLDVVQVIIDGENSKKEILERAMNNM